MARQKYRCTKGRFFGMDAYDVKPLDGEWWRIQNPEGIWGFEFECDGRAYRVVPREKADTDFATMPNRGLIWRMFGPPTGHGKGHAYGPPTVMHDEGYTTGKVQQLQDDGSWKLVDVHRRFCDEYFNCAMRCRVQIECEVIEEMVPVRKKFWLVHVAGWRRVFMYTAVRVGGGPHWRKHGHPLD